MKKRLFSLFLVLALMLPLMSFGVSADYGPGPEDLDRIKATCDYPKDSDYLDDYEYMYVKGSQNERSVYCLHGLNDGSNWKSKAIIVPGGTYVQVIAIHSYKSGGKNYSYACCIFSDSDWNRRAGWINMVYLEARDTAYYASHADKNFGTGSRSIRNALSSRVFESFLYDQHDYAPRADSFPIYYDDGILHMDWKGYYAAWSACSSDFVNGYNDLEGDASAAELAERLEEGYELTVNMYCTGDEDWFISSLIPYDEKIGFEKYVNSVYPDILSWSTHLSEYNRDDNMQIFKIPYNSKEDAVVLFMKPESFYSSAVIFVPVLIDFNGTPCIPVYYISSYSLDNILDLFSRSKWV